MPNGGKSNSFGGESNSGLKLIKIKTRVERFFDTTPVDEFFSEHFKKDGRIIAYFYGL